LIRGLLNSPVAKMQKGISRCNRYSYSNTLVYPYLIPHLYFYLTFTPHAEDWAIHGWKPLPKMERRAPVMNSYTRGPEPCVHDGYTQKQFNDAAKSVEKDMAGEPWPL